MSASAYAIAVSAGFDGVDLRAHPLRRSGGGGGGTLSVPLSAPDQYEAILGRKLRPTPAHLTDRVLYVPSHNDTVTHLPIYDFKDDFREAVRDEPIGSSRFKTSFGLMPKPIGDGRGTSKVAYLLDFEPLEARTLVVSGPEPRPHRRKSSLGLVVTKATVQRRMLGGASAQPVGLTIPPRLLPPRPGSQMRAKEKEEEEEEEGAVAFSMTPSSTTRDIAVQTSFPMSPTVSRFGSSRHPWFTFTVPSLLDEERTFQWQVHPVEHGLLRYTLVEIPSNTALSSATRRGTTNPLDDPTEDIPFSAAKEGNEGRIRAIYHNVGLGFCLSQPYSEGAVLLQKDLDPELEALIVASLLGLLWRVRNEESRPRKSSKSEGSTVVERKKSVGEGDSPTQTGSKKSLLGKILRKK